MATEESTALAVVEQGTRGALAASDPKAVIQQATREANELARVIEDRKLYSNISGRKYVRVEGWTTLAVMRGCLAREVETTDQPDGRYIAVVELVRLTDGAVLTRASAECGGADEPTWQNRPPYARRSMAQTRAAGKACRIAFSWVMALTGYETTPAEEMDGVVPRGNGGGQRAQGQQRSSGGKRSSGAKATDKQRKFLDRLEANPLLPAEWRERISGLLGDDNLTKDDASKCLDICTKKLDEIKAANEAAQEEPAPTETDDEPEWMREPPPPDDIPV